MGTTWWRYTAHTVAGLGLLAFAVATMVATLLRLIEFGSCATSPVYATLRPCPQRIEGLMLLFIAMPAVGVVGWLVYARRVDPRRPSPFDGGPDWSGWWWPGMFLGFAYGFVLAGNALAGAGQRSAWAMWACAAAFAVFGGVPLLSRRRAPPFAAPDVRTAGGRTASVPGIAIGSPAVPGASGSPALPGASPPSGPPPADGDTVAALERLAALYRAGHLGDAEFARAKDRVLRRDRGAPR